MRLVFDTNVYLAAVFSGGLCYEIFMTVLNRESGFLLFISKQIFEELLEKIEMFRNEEKLDEDRYREFIRVLGSGVNLVYSSERIKAVESDPDDDIIIECAIAAEADIIVSMDRHLLKLRSFRNIAIVHPKTFSRILPKK